ncbi:rhodanese-like domain-containing protein [Anaerobacillus alkaliphilus]|uniref:Rhodanese-like domain-containing protein n=1 Tax=Anaerobacillus alkaliphilus TaxID=1548597 RepID=A0A4Q0VQ63_9BACI|nr:rhodanese-like domain-containing protein [Anaerobacillus alkaliphilus]RXI98319.1 rhodanese-like domain-containing protein [Anaerobacillus alkaliphilus]
MSFMHEGVKQIELNELKDILSNKPENVIIIDVREQEEYDSFHIPEIPLIPMSNFPNIIDDLKKDKEYILVCRSGSRSHNVARFLKANGFEEAHNFYGGMLTWDEEVHTGPENVITDLNKLYE